MVKQRKKKREDRKIKRGNKERKRHKQIRQ